jgi:hypothetical protein
MRKRCAKKSEAVAARRTYDPERQFSCGHEKTEENTRVQTRGTGLHTACRICIKASGRKHQAKKRAEAKRQARYDAALAKAREAQERKREAAKAAKAAEMARWKCAAWRPSREVPWALVTWRTTYRETKRNEAIQMVEPTPYFSTKRAALDAAPADRPFSVVNVMRTMPKPPSLQSILRQGARPIIENPYCEGSGNWQKREN